MSKTASGKNKKKFFFNFGPKAHLAHAAHARSRALRRLPAHQALTWAWVGIWRARLGHIEPSSREHIWSVHPDRTVVRFHRGIKNASAETFLKP